MSRNYYRLLYMVAFSVLLYGCATESAPTGGKEDKEAPVMKQASPANYSTHFSSNKIEITFNEFIQQGSFSQTLISPPMDKPPIYGMHGKTLVIKLRTELLPNTTYTINFGDDIKDLNNGNIAPNFTYVFSTGDYIDSQSVSGKVILASDGTPAESIVVGLYPKDSSNGVQHQKPIYFAKTSKAGTYQINNVKADKYNMYALKDQNFNYIYDQPNELIGFIDSLIDLTDTIPVKADFTIFTEEVKKVSIQSVKSIQAGMLQIIYNGTINDFSLTGKIGSNTNKIYYNTTKDTLNYWYSNYYVPKDTLFTVANDTVLDTTRIELKFISKDTMEQALKYPLIIVNQSNTGGFNSDSKENINIQRLYGALKINFNRPTVRINDLKQAEIVADSTEKRMPVSLMPLEDTTQFYTLNFEREEKAGYTLVIPDSMFLDIFGLWNKRIEWHFKTDNKDLYGNIKLTLKNEHPGKNYLIKLLDANDNIVRQFTLKEETEKKVEISNIPAGIYHFAVLNDANNNGRWDTGNLLNKQQPEKIYTIADSYTLKGGWDLDVEVKF